MKNIITFVALFLLSGFSSLAQAQSSATQEAFAMAKASGKSLFLLGGNESWPPCEVMMRRFGTDPKLRKYAEWFIPIKLEISSKEWSEFRKTYKHDGGYSPYVFIVRADGEQLYGSGKRISAKELYMIVEDSIAKSGRVLNGAEISMLSAAAESANTQLDSGDLKAAIKTMMSVKKIGMPGEINSFAASAITANEMAERIDKKVARRLEGIQSELDDEQTAADAAIKMASAINEIIRWVPRKNEFDELKKQFKNDDKLDSLLQQAILYEEMSEAQRQQNFTKLLSSYRKLVTDFEDGSIVPRGKSLLESTVTPELATSDDFYVMWESSNGFRTTAVMKSAKKNDSGEIVSVSIVDRREKVMEVPVEKLDVVSKQLAEIIVAQR